MASVTLPISGYASDYKYANESTSYPISNAVGSTSSSGTKYAGINLTTGSGAVTYVYMTFDTSEIPANATITSVTGSVRLYGSTTGHRSTTTRTIQLYSGTTAKGSSVSFDLTGSATIYNITDGGTWTRDELNDARIRLYLTRNSSNTTSNRYCYWLGGDITVEYEEIPLVYHTITTQVGDNITIDKSASESVGEGTSFELTITGSVQSITDNGTDVLSQLVEKHPTTGGTVTSYPTAYTTSGSVRGTNYQNAIGNGSDNTASGNDYCSSSGSTANIIYSFDFSSIPENAVIDSVSVTVGGHLESTSNSSEVAQLQLYSGDTTKGSQVSFTSTSKQVITMDAGTWTREELQDAKLQFTIGYYGGLVNGVDFVVNYSIPSTGDDVYYVYTIASVNEDHEILINIGETGTNLRVKINGTYKKVMKIYCKVDGVFVEKTVDDLPSGNIKWVT